MTGMKAERRAPTIISSSKVQVIGWDLGSQRCGWAACDFERPPIAGAFRLAHCTPDTIGDMGSEFTDQVMDVHRRYPGSTHWVSERPLLRPVDNRFKVERLHGLSFLLQTIGRRLDITCRMVEPRDVKSEFAGRHASKDQMVAMALKLGISLPEKLVDGREDAADAVGVLKVGVRLFARNYLEKWDQAIYSNRGHLL